MSPASSQRGREPRTDSPDHVHHQDDVEDDEEVVRVPEDLVAEHPEIDIELDFFKKHQRERFSGVVAPGSDERKRKGEE